MRVSTWSYCSIRFHYLGRTGVGNSYKQSKYLKKKKNNSLKNILYVYIKSDKTLCG